MKANKKRKGLKERTAKRFAAMDSKQLAAATKQFDEDLVIDQTRSLTADEKDRWKKAKRKRGRPKVGQGIRVIAVSLERTLLAKADRRAKKLGISRAALITRGLESVLAETHGNGSR